MKTRLADTWLHLMFLALQAKSAHALSQQDAAIHSLKMTFEHVSGHPSKSSTPTSTPSAADDHANNASSNSASAERAFASLVTSAFPNYRQQEALLIELKRARYYDLFQYNALTQRWSCFLCSDPQSVAALLRQDPPILSGELKELRSPTRWAISLLQYWKKRSYTLRGNTLFYTVGKGKQRRNVVAVDVRRVRAARLLSASGSYGPPGVPSSSSVSRSPSSSSSSSSSSNEDNGADSSDADSIRHVGGAAMRHTTDWSNSVRSPADDHSSPNAFEILTDVGRTLVLQCKSRREAEQWVRGIRSSLARAQNVASRESSSSKASSPMPLPTAII